MKKKYILLIFISFPILFSSCGSSNISNTDIDYTSLKTVKSKYSDLQFNIPQNFFEVEKKDKSFFDICIVDNSYSKAVYLVPLIFDEETELLENIDIEKIANYSIILKEAEYDISVDRESLTLFEVNGRKTASYKFLDKNQKPVEVFLFIHKSGPQELSFVLINSEIYDKYPYFDENIKELILTSMK